MNDANPARARMQEAYQKLACAEKAFEAELFDPGMRRLSLALKLIDTLLSFFDECAEVLRIHG